MIRALIFDVDGTLAETEELHRRAFNDTFRAAGLGWHWSRADYGRLLTTTGGKERITRHLQDLGLDPAGFPVAALHAAKTERYGALIAAGELALRPGIGALLAEARRVGLRLACATTTSAPNVEALCRACFGKAAGDVFEVIAAGDIVAAKKPAPDIYRHALADLNLGPEQAVAFEDSANGLRAARAAGLACVVSPGVYTLQDEFPGALAVLDCFSELGGIAGLAALLAPAQ